MKKIGKLVGVCNCQCHCGLKECFTDHDTSCEHCWNYINNCAGREESMKRNKNNGEVISQEIICSFCNGTGKIVISNINQLFGYKLQILRKEKVMTQKELAERLNVSRTSLTNIEAGRQRVSINQMYAIATALEISIKDLM